MPSPNEILGVSPDADLATIKRVFRALVKEWHPDRNRDPRASARFRELVAAYRSMARDRTQHVHRARTSSAPRAATAWAPAVAVVGDDLCWEDPAATHLALAYPKRLARNIVLGTIGFVASFWVSALLSHL